MSRLGTSSTAGRISAAILASLFVVGCGSGSPTPKPSAGATSTPSTASTTSASATAGAGGLVAIDCATLADSPVGRQLTWTLGQLNVKAAGLTATDLTGRFTPYFLTQVPSSQMMGALEQVGASGPFTLTACETNADRTMAQARLAGGSKRFAVAIQVEPAAPNLMAMLMFNPVASDAAAQNWTDVNAALASLAPDVSLTVAEIKADKCVPVHQLAADKPRAIGSAFKLYVLGELGRQVEAGSAKWDEQLAVNDAWKSLPSGTVQNEPAGTKHPLSYFADQMISISDNTAADHLIHRLGRTNVESNLAAMGIADPSLDTPFILTRDMFTLKATKNAALKKQYLAADAAGRRTLLDTTVAKTPLAAGDLADWTTPRDVDTLEWFASTNELCSAMANLHRLSAQPGQSPILHALSINPAISLDPSVWTFVGYKGGSEPGVLNMTWLVQRADGRWFSVSVTCDDPARATDNVSSVASIANDTFRLLAAVK